LVLADACNQDGYWDTYGDVLGFHIPNSGGGKAFGTGRSATIFVSAQGTLESDVFSGASYGTQDEVFFVCDSSPKLRFDWDSDYEDSLPIHDKGCDRAFLEVIYAPVPQAQTSTVG
jgi:hypothetical protein